MGACTITIDSPDRISRFTRGSMIRTLHITDRGGATYRVWVDPDCKPRRMQRVYRTREGRTVWRHIEANGPTWNRIAELAEHESHGQPLEFDSPQAARSEDEAV